MDITKENLNIFYKDVKNIIFDYLFQLERTEKMDKVIANIKNPIFYVLDLFDGTARIDLHRMEIYDMEHNCYTISYPCMQKKYSGRNISTFCKKCGNFIGEIYNYEGKIIVPRNNYKIYERIYCNCDNF